MFVIIQDSSAERKFLEASVNWMFSQEFKVNIDQLISNHSH